MLFNGISHYLEANLEFLPLCYFFAWAFCLCYFYAFSNYGYIQFLLNRCVKPETGWWGEVNLKQNQPSSPTPWQAGTTFSPTSSQPDLFTVMINVIILIHYAFTNLECNRRIHGDFIHLTLWVVTFWMAWWIFLCDKNCSLGKGKNMWCLNKKRNRVVSSRASTQYVKCCLVWRNMKNAVLFGAITSRYMWCLDAFTWECTTRYMVRRRVHILLFIFVNLFLTLGQSALHWGA